MPLCGKNRNNEIMQPLGIFICILNWLTNSQDQVMQTITSQSFVCKTMYISNLHFMSRLSCANCGDGERFKKSFIKSKYAYCSFKTILLPYIMTEKHSCTLALKTMRRLLLLMFEYCYSHETILLQCEPCDIVSRFNKLDDCNRCSGAFRAMANVIACIYRHCNKCEVRLGPCKCRGFCQFNIKWLNNPEGECYCDKKSILLKFYGLIECKTKLV